MSVQKQLFFLALLFSFLTISLAQSSCTSIPDAQKVDCGYLGINSTQCQNKGCCWVPASVSGENIPWCFYQSSCSNLNFSATSPGFTQSDINTMITNFEKNLNIGGLGGVAASPDQTMDPQWGPTSYYYNWQRDGALSMEAFMLINQNNLSVISTNMNSYVNWVINVQNQSDPFGYDIRVEPKFNLNNYTVFNGTWCRPQNDGPSLRSTTLMNYANLLLNNGNNSYVSQYLWTGNSNYNGGAIKYDLDWVANNFIGSTTCDLWEDLVDQNIFWNYMVTRKALLIGSQFAQTMGDSTSATKYSNVATQIQNQIESLFWSGTYFFEASNREVDGAVILALYTGYNNDGFIAPTDSKVASTIAAYNQIFCQLYPINLQDSSNGVPGILYGRYINDTYYGGNPWILISSGLAKLLYSGANYALNNQQVSTSTLNAWTSVFPNLITENSSYSDFAAVLANAGNSILQRIYYHASGNSFNLFEQLDKNTGFQISAYDLSWSYANTLEALFLYNTYSQNILLAQQ